MHWILLRKKEIEVNPSGFPSLRVSAIFGYAPIRQPFPVSLKNNIDNNKYEITRTNYQPMYLTEEEIKLIEEVELPFDYLRNARNSLVISCYTAPS